FTKETAVFAPVSALLILVFVLKTNWRAKSNLIQYGMWVLGFIIWYAARSVASIVGSEADPRLATGLVERFPLLIQYIGKIFLPFNLSPFPIMEDTVYYYGIAGILLLIAIIILAKEKDWKKILAGLLIFLSFLVPVFLVPAAINTQTFEHRLYLPMIGMLIVVSQTALFNNRFDEKQLLTGGTLLIIILAVLNFLHQRHFKDELSFWTQAVKTSPNSAYAIMMLGAKLEDPAEGAKMFRRAYAIDSTEKYINYYYGAMLQYQDSILESERYLLAEKQRSDFVECDFMLARVAVEKNNIPAAIEYLENFLARAPLHDLGNTNLLQLYVQSGDLVKARLQMISMDQKGLPVAEEVRKVIGG
ncbi:MAG TPA: hypothetical protein VI603_06325, partial [Saprospiraceae bacterium]|nr:hypothetical protein [Saprospiraceae bacterium]